MKQSKILVGGYDMEQKVQRGITFYGKALIKTLTMMDAKVDILTSAPYKKEDKIQLLNVLRKLDNPEPFHKSRKKKILNFLLFKLNFYKAKYGQFDERDYENKLLYLKQLNGFLNLPHIYDATATHNSINKEKPFVLKEIKNYDYFITTSPMNIKLDSKVRLIQTLHDVLPIFELSHPSDDSSDVFYYRLKNMLENSYKVLSISEYSKQEVIKLFPQYADKIAVVHQPIPIYDDEYTLSQEPIVQKSVLDKYRLKQGDYLFYVGMLEKRKNIKSLIEAHLAIYDKVGIPLVLAGSLGHGKEEFNSYVSKKRYKSKIIYLDYINNIDKLVLLNNARAFLFPSLGEGFGLPPLEAMRMDCPVLTSNNSSLPEVCGDAALYVDPYSVNDLAEKIEQIANDELLRKELIKKGKIQVEKFSYENFKNNLKSVLEI